MRIRHALFWLVTAFAAVTVLWVLSDFMFGLEARFPVINIAGLILAAAIWGVGWICRFAPDVRLSLRSIADEMREESRKAVLGD